MELFASAFAKVDRAQEQAESLEREITAFFAEKTYETREHFDSETGRKVATFHTTREIPALRWAVIAGEIFHNLRSALDHAITDLTVRDTGHPLEGTEFPIFDDETKYNTLRSKGAARGEPAPTSGLHKIRGVNAATKAVIHWLQPFEIRKRKPGAPPAALTTMRALNVIDKHRAIHLIRASAHGGGWRLNRPIDMPLKFVLPVGEFKDGAIVAEWGAVTHVEGEMDVEFEINFRIVFAEAADSDIAHLNGLGLNDVCASGAVGVRWMLGRLLGGTDDPPL